MRISLTASLIAFILACVTNVYGDEPPDIEIVYLCDKPADRLELRLFYIENGVEMLQKNENDNNKFERIHGGEVRYEGKGDKTRIKSIDSEYRFCELKKGTYKVTFTSVYGNTNPYGRCGGERSMAAEITEPPWYAVKQPDIYGDEKGNTIMGMRGFTNSCGASSGFLIKNVVFNSEIEKVTITEVNGLSMYRPLASE